MKIIFTAIVGTLWFASLFLLHRTARDSFDVLWSLYTIAFVAYLLFIFRLHLKLHQGIFLAILIRFCALWETPLLSDDYYRFLWDGGLTEQGVHPMAYTPRQAREQHAELIVRDSLFQKLNSKDYYSVYPPAAQGLFYVGFLLNGWSPDGFILYFKLLLLFADLGIFCLLYFLLKKKSQSPDKLLWYALNPLVILEFTGNLHFDSVMILGLLAAIYFSEMESFIKSTLSFTFSILVKFLSLILIPFIHKSWSIKKLFFFAVTSVVLTGIVIGLSFQQQTSYVQSIGLWFHQFEFNASLYYVARRITTLFIGYNAIHVLGPLLAILSSMIILFIWFRFRKNPDFNMPEAMLFVMTVFFLFSTTVHPWYIGILIALSVMTSLIYPIAWSYLIYLSYSHYDNGGMTENYLLIILEYISLGLFLYWERKKIVLYFSR